MEAPPASHPAWIALLTGKASHQPMFMAARLLIVRCQTQLAKASDPKALVQEFVARLRDLYAQNADCPSVKQDLSKLFG